MKKKIIFAFSIFSLIPLLALAESYGDVVAPEFGTIPCFIHGLIGIMVKVGIPLGAIFFIVAGFLFVTSNGDPKKITVAKNAFMWTCIGFGVLLSSWIFSGGLLNTIATVMGGTPQADVCSGGD